MRTFVIAIAAFFIVGMLYAMSMDIRWFRQDYERAHGLPDRTSKP